jgi:thiol:disulfide interchange protein DsbD
LKEIIHLLLLMAALCIAQPAGAQIKLGNSGSPDLLEPEKAFRFSARSLEDDALEVRFAIADGYYMYRERFKFELDGASAVRLGKPEFPPGVRKTDAFFGDVETYRKEVRIRVPLERGAGEARTLRLEVTSQGCADVGVCYAPMQSQASLRLASFRSGDGLDPDARAGGGSRLPGFSLTLSDFDVAALFEGSPWRVLASFLAFGLLLAFTPCVLPMVPILSSIIVGEGANPGKARALALSSAYVGGVAIAYAAAGIVAAYAGNLLAASLQHPAVLVVFALLFVALAASMFGLYELRLPGFLHHRLAGVHHRLEGGRIASVSAMGFFSAVVVSPCVAAPLAGALLYISQSRDIALGAAALATMAIGMGIPLVAVGVFEGAWLPRGGAWMGRVRKFVGILLLAVAAWIAWPLVQPSGAPAGFTRIASVVELDAKLAAADRPVMLDFYADWCVSCREMEAFTFSNEAVRARLDTLLLLQVDVTANTPSDRELLKRFALFGPPGIVFFDAQGRELRGLRVIGYQNAERFLDTLSRIPSAAR